MEYGPEFHGHERVLRSERVFHDFDPARAHQSQFLHPVVRYYRAGPIAQGQRSPRHGAEEGRGAWKALFPIRSEHHVLEDVFTNFQSQLLHKGKAVAVAVATVAVAVVAVAVAAAAAAAAAVAAAAADELPQYMHRCTREGQ